MDDRLCITYLYVVTFIVLVWFSIVS